MYKNQLQELAQRSCFNLPSYTCIREGPDHAPRFKASVNFNGELFESPTYCSTLRQAEHAAAEVSLNVLSSRLPSKSLTAKILDETGIYKNLLQETAHRAGLDLPIYTSVRSGSYHFPAFSCTVELAGLSFTGESAKTKKQAEKNAAIAAWSSLRKMSSLDSKGGKEENGEEKEQEVVARVLSRFKPKEVRRRETTNQRRRRSQQDTNKDLSERLRWINLLTHEPPPSSTQKQYQKTSLVSLIPPTQSQASRTNLQQYKGKPPQEDKPETEMIITKSFPLPMAAPYKAKLNESSGGYSKQIPFSDRGRFGFVGGCNRLAPAVQIRSVIPVYAAPPSKLNPNPSVSSSLSEPIFINSCSVPKTPGLGGQEKNPIQMKILDQTHD
ncbi:unnamed protein product [Eruca vesicaria subsp. sativa]|uniref:DRBM domain-containing protein n=1 Tax=Eruca vesicaria subsp. sativa TaxID=29727 RepID=A0ABC8KGC0_ERUVS|nr:unnamed protein product [Eruca vesicaria subsp. sativa]